MVVDYYPLCTAMFLPYDICCDVMWTNVILYCNVLIVFHGTNWLQVKCISYFACVKKHIYMHHHYKKHV